MALGIGSVPQRGSVGLFSSNNNSQNIEAKRSPDATALRYWPDLSTISDFRGQALVVKDWAERRNHWYRLLCKWWPM